MTKFLRAVLLVSVCFVTAKAGNDLDTKAIDEYIASKMRWPRIPGLALAIPTGFVLLVVAGRHGFASEGCG